MSVRVLSTVLMLLAISLITRAGEEKIEKADKPDYAALVKGLAEGNATDRDAADSKLRKGGREAIAALRDAKPEKEDAVDRVRNLLADVAIDVAQVDAADAEMLHQLAREEGKGKRYGNAERLYRNAEITYEKLKDVADKKKQKDKEKEYSEKQRVCDRMKDKAGHKLKGETHSGVNLGFVRVGKEHDMSDDWE
jgi:hypothetical protein